MDTGWGFSSLGGAMFSQLYQVLGAQSGLARCDFCGKVIIGARKGTRFCLNGGSCRNKYDNLSGRRVKRERGKKSRS
jgi:hypothetical protein